MEQQIHNSKIEYLNKLQRDAEKRNSKKEFKSSDVTYVYVYDFDDKVKNFFNNYFTKKPIRYRINQSSGKIKVEFQNNKRYYIIKMQSLRQNQIRGRLPINCIIDSRLDLDIIKFIDYELRYCTKLEYF